MEISTSDKASVNFLNREWRQVCQVRWAVGMGQSILCRKEKLPSIQMATIGTSAFVLGYMRGVLTLLSTLTQGLSAPLLLAAELS